TRCSASPAASPTTSGPKPAPPARPDGRVIDCLGRTSKGARMATTDEQVRMDTTDVDRQLGAWLGGGQLLEPVTGTDIRRWVQGMQYPNPLHYDEQAAAAGPFGGLVAPQSFAVRC